jgi:hypothetical protein
MKQQNTIESRPAPDAALELLKEDRYSTMWGDGDVVKTGLPLSDLNYERDDDGYLSHAALEALGELCCKFGRYEILNAMLQSAY